MKYLIALICPPLALAQSGKPVRAGLAALGLIVAVLTWSTGVGVLLAAVVIGWACRTVGDTEAAEEVGDFLKHFNSRNAA